MRIINADDAKRAIEHADPAFSYVIDNVPTINAIPNGKWEWRGKDRGYFCTNCGSGCLLNYESDWHESNFCPHCGADMRGNNEY